MTTEMTTAISRRCRLCGRYPQTQDGAAPKREKRIPEYLEADEINAIIRGAPSPKARLLMLEQWRAGLRVCEALDLEVRDLSLDTQSPTLRANRRCNTRELIAVRSRYKQSIGDAIVGRSSFMYPAMFACSAASDKRGAPQ